MTKFDMKIYKEVGKLLKEARTKKNISLDTLCSLLNGAKTKSTLKRYEDGVSRMDMETLSSICNALGINHIELIETASNIVNSSQWGDDRSNREHLEDKPELLNLYNEIRQRDEMFILFDKVKDLSPEDVESVLSVVNTIRKAKGFEE